MRVTRRARSIACVVVSAMLGSTALMKDRSIAAHSSPTVRAVTSLGSAARQADGSGPLTVTPALDVDRAVTAIVTTDGGTLTATAANGAVFTLTIPRGALLDQESITMTPVASISDLPFSGGLAGAGAVQLGPDGLILLQPATLAIQATSPLSLDEQSPFAWSKTGEDFHLYPLTLDPTTLTMEITHFSGYGAGSGSSGERGAARDHSPGRSTSELEQQVQKLAEDARQKLSQNPTKKQTKKINKQYKNEVVNAEESLFESLLDDLKADLASGNEAALRCRLSALLSSLVQLHEKKLELANLVVDMAPTVSKAIQTLIDKASSRCQDNISEIGNLLGLAKFASLLAGYDSALSGLSSVAQKAVAAATKCGSLKMSFDSTATLGTLGQPVVTLDITLKASVQLTPIIDKDGVSVKFTGQGPLKHDPEPPKASVVECSVTGQGTDSILNVISFEFQLKLREVDCTNQDSAPPTDFKAVIDVGRPVENYDVQCPDGIAATAHGEVWRGQFFCRHQHDAQGGSQFTLTGWTPGGSPSNPATLCGLYDFQAPACPLLESAVIEVTRGQ